MIMNKKLFLVFIGICLVSMSVQAQDFRTSNLKEGSNYFEIVAKNKLRLENKRSKGDRKSKKEVKQFERWAAFWRDRVLSDGSFVSEAHNYNEWKKMNKRNIQQSNSAVSAANWSLVGPTVLPTSSVSFYPGMGRINSLSFNGTDTSTMYVGTPAGGVWKTIDGGSTWSSKGEDLPNLGVSDIAIDPSNTNVLYLASGDTDGGQNRSLGVFKSTNGGDTWALTGLAYTLGQNGLTTKLLIDPNNTNTVFATTFSSIKRTTDGGTTWTDVHTDSNANFNDIVYKKGSNSVLYATSRTGKFYISKDSGGSWSEASSPSNSRLDIALTDDDPNLIITLDNGGVLRKSTDEGTTWLTISTIPGFESQGGYNVSVAISPINKDLIIAGGIEGWRSSDGGTNWENYLVGYWIPGQPFFYVHSDHHDMKFIPGTNTAFSLNDGGIFRGNAAIDTPWDDLSSGLAITQYYNVSGTPQDSGKLIIGAQDNDVAVYDGATFVGQNAGSDGVEGLWDYSNSNIAWSCSQSGRMERTLDNFATTSTISTPSGAPFVWQLEIHPTIPTTIFGGFGDIYASTDRGDNWGNLYSNAGVIDAISISPSNPDVIYVSGYDGFKVATDGGGLGSWKDVTLPQTGLVKSIEVHPTNPEEIYIAYAGYKAGKVYRSTDSGVSWTNITGSLPNIPTHKIIYKTGSTDGELFLATDLGVFHRTNTSGDWTRLGNGLPNVIVYDIEIHYGTEMLRAATFGRGVWEIPVSDAVLNIEDNKLPFDAVTLYPNPTKNKEFTIQLNKLEGESNITIYNIIGGIVKDYETTSTQEIVDLNGFSQGLYLVNIRNKGRRIVKRIIIK